MNSFKIHNKNVCLITLLLGIASAVLLSFMQFSYAEAQGLIKKIEVANGSMVQFESDVYRYTVQLDEGEKYATLNVVPESEDVSIQIDGDQEEVKPGSRAIITVSAHDNEGNFATYTLEVYAQSNTQGSLSFLRCLNGTMSPQFRESARVYYIVLPYDADHAELDIRARDAKAQISVMGNENIDAGSRKKVVIEITNSDGSKGSYELYVYRQREITSNIDSQYLLASVKINGGKVPFTFEQTKGYYRVAVPSRISTLDIEALPEDSKNIVQVLGTDTLENSEHNIVTIVVSNPENEQSGRSVYVFDFYRKSYVFSPVFSWAQMTFVAVISICATAAISIVLSYRSARKRG